MVRDADGVKREYAQPMRPQVLCALSAATQQKTVTSVAFVQVSVRRVAKSPPHHRDSGSGTCSLGGNQQKQPLEPKAREACLRCGSAAREARDTCVGAAARSVSSSASLPAAVIRAYTLPSVSSKKVCFAQANPPASAMYACCAGTASKKTSWWLGRHGACEQES